MSTELQISTGKTVYVLSDFDGAVISGPLLGEPGLDLAEHAEAFRAECHAAAQAKQDDHCFISDRDFIGWLIDRGVLVPLKSETMTVHVDTSGDHRYAPKHWPECPACGRGRGEEESGQVLHALNRWQWHRKCTECGHVWDHQDHPYQHDKPMLEDDGRYIEAGCVPYTISQAGGLLMERVVEVCREHGWREGAGMSGNTTGLAAARALGLAVKRVPLDFDGRPTLRRVMTVLSQDKSYIVAIKEHWLPVVRGENRDSAESSLRSEVECCWEVSL